MNVILNSVFFEKRTSPPGADFFRHSIRMVVCEAISGKPWNYKDIDYGIDLDTRIALVGPNETGKSTLLKLPCSGVLPTDGLIRRHSHVKIRRNHEDLHEELHIEKQPLEFMMSSFLEVKEKKRMILRRYGITGREQVRPMEQLSDDQRCLVSFAWLALQRHHLLLLDQPTNHLDMESIDAFAEASTASPEE